MERIWDGAKAIALRLEYDAYVLDEASRSIYLTDSVDGLTIDGIIRKRTPTPH